MTDREARQAAMARADKALIDIAWFEEVYEGLLAVRDVVNRRAKVLGDRDTAAIYYGLALVADAVEEELR